jgi:hypothetical protein
MLDPARGADLAFLEPDNGIEVPSKSVGRKGSSKYVTWREIRPLWRMDCSILIYQHFRREQCTAFRERMASELRESVPARVSLKPSEALMCSSCWLFKNGMQRSSGRRSRNCEHDGAGRSN